MNRQDLVAVGLALVGFCAIVVGIHQDLVQVAPGYPGLIETGWDGSLSHEERLLAQLAALGVGGTIATIRWRSAAVLPLAVGVVELFYSIRAVISYAREPGLYTEVTLYDGTVTRFVLGAEPSLLVLGGLLVLGAGIVGWRAHGNRSDASGPSQRTPQTAQ